MGFGDFEADGVGADAPAGCVGIDIAVAKKSLMVPHCFYGMPKRDETLWSKKRMVDSLIVGYRCCRCKCRFFVCHAR